MKDTTRKNKVNQALNIPTTAYYTLKELFDANKHFNAQITIRVRHTKEIEAGNIAEIGNLVGGHGRPQKVYAKTPITKLLLTRAETEGISLADNVHMLTNVISVTPTSPALTPVMS